MQLKITHLTTKMHQSANSAVDNCHYIKDSWFTITIKLFFLLD